MSGLAPKFESLSNKILNNSHNTGLKITLCITLEELPAWQCLLSTIVLLTRHLYRRGTEAADGRCELVWLGRQGVSVGEKRCGWKSSRHQKALYICQSQSPNSSHSPCPPLYPYVCSLHLCLYFYFVSKVISTNFFRLHIYALTYDICFSLSETSLHTTVSRSIYVSINDLI